MGRVILIVSITIGAARMYAWNLFLGVDQFANIILLGDPDETISSRAGKAVKRTRIARALCRLLNRIDPDHCNRSIEADEGLRSVWLYIKTRLEVGR